MESQLGLAYRFDSLKELLKLDLIERWPDVGEVCLIYSRRDPNALVAIHFDGEALDALMGNPQTSVDSAHGRH